MAELLSAAEAAQMLGVTKNTIDTLIRENAIPVIRLPGLRSRRMFSRRWLERYIEVLAERAEEERAAAAERMEAARAEAVRPVEEEIAAMDSYLERFRLRKTG